MSISLGAQPQPPGPPQNLAVTVAGTTVTLAWAPPSTGSPPASYVVEAAVSPGGPALASLTLTATTFSVPNVPNGVYFVRVRGVDASGVGPPSNEVVATVPGGGPPTGCSAPPNAPQGLAGSAAGNAVSLNWSAPAGGCPATGFVVLAGSAPNQANLAQVNVGLQVGLSANAPAGAYFIRVVAVNAFGQSSPSNELALTVTASSGQQAQLEQIARQCVTVTITEQPNYCIQDYAGAVLTIANSCTQPLEVLWCVQVFDSAGSAVNPNVLKWSCGQALVAPGGTYGSSACVLANNTTYAAAWPPGTQLERYPFPHGLQYP